MLDLEHVSIEYSGTEVVHDFSMHMNEGEVISIVGESGSGKTTVIRAIMGMLPNGGTVTGGTIRFDGKMLSDLSERMMTKIRGEDIAMIFQDSGSTLNPIRTIGSQFIEYIRLHRNVTKDQAKEKALLMLRQVRLPEPENVMRSYPFQLSGGMKQRVGIAMALTFNPKLLLADEPTSALDVTTQAQIVRQMIEMRTEYRASIILVTHNLGVAAYMANHILVMKDGMIVEQGDRDKILHHPESDYTKALLASIPDMEGDVYI